MRRTDIQYQTRPHQNSWWVEIETALHGLQGSGQHRYAGEHDFGSFHGEARLFQSALDVVWSEAHSIRVIKHTSEEIPGGKGRPLASVVDHEIVHKDQTAWRKGIKCSASQDSIVISSDCTPNIGHENNIVTFWPIRCDGVSGQMRNTVGQSGLLRILPRRLDCLREIENGCLEQRVCPTEGKCVSPATSAYVE